MNKREINRQDRLATITEFRATCGLPTECADRTCILLVLIKRASAVPVQMGLIVDGLNELPDFPVTARAPAPLFGRATLTNDTEVDDLKACHAR